MGAAVPKVLLTLGPEPLKKSIVRRSVEAFATDPECERVVVCVPNPWLDHFERDLLELEGVVLVDGGATRQESVWKGIQHLRGLDEVGGESIVLVHDAARCCVSREVIGRLIAAVTQHGAAATAVRVVDSLCRSPDGGLGESVDRANIWALQTPQGFILQDLVRGHKEALARGVEALHDAALVAPFRPVKIVEGDRLNIKVTEPADLALAQTLLTACGEKAGLVVGAITDNSVGV